MDRVVKWSMALAIGMASGLPDMAGAQDSGATFGALETNRVQLVRSEVDVLTTAQADPAALRAGAARLEAALARLDDKQVREAAAGNDVLLYRRHDLQLDLARLYARLGDPARALSALDAAQRVVWVSDDVIGLASDPAFVALRSDARFQGILARARVAQRIWRGPGASVPYQAQLRVQERIAGLTQFWSEARAHFVYFDHVPELDWDRVYLDYLPKVMAASSTLDYYRVMMQLAPLLHDGHTNIYPPPQLAERLHARPPITSALVEDRVLVLRVDSAQLAQRVRAGDKIVAIDGVPVQRYARQRIAPFVSSSTVQDRQARMFGNDLLAGDARVALALTLRDASGRTRKERVARGGYHDIVRPGAAPFRMLPGGVAYVALEQFDTDAALKAFEAALPRIMQAGALVIDVRENGGGSSEHGVQVLRHLSALALQETPQYVRNDNPYMQGRNASVTWLPAQRAGTPPGAAAATAAPAPVYTGKVALLTSARTFSAAEDFVLAFRALKRGVTVGQSTGGSTGMPLYMALPGGGTARICVKRDLTPDGRDFVGTGLAPDLEVAPTVEAVRAGRDLVLERAQRMLADGA